MITIQDQITVIALETTPTVVTTVKREGFIEMRNLITDGYQIGEELILDQGDTQEFPVVKIFFKDQKSIMALILALSTLALKIKNK